MNHPAEVWIDGESLGEKLKSEGLAKGYVGEEARSDLNGARINLLI